MPLIAVPQGGGVATKRFANRLSLLSILVIVLAVAAVWLLTLDMRHLLKSDEGRYAEIAREMFATGDWVTIRYNGVKYFEKPPFHLWMTAIAFELFGVGEWQARLWVAISGLIGLGAATLAARRWFGLRVALVTALVLLATPAWNIGSHFNSLDMGVSAALVCALSALLIAQHPETSKRGERRWMLAAWAAMAIGTLTKGLIGIVLPGMVLVVYTVVAWDRGVWKRLHIVAGAALFLIITAPWFVLVSIRNPEFPQFFFIHEHWQRYTSSVHLRDAPAWYFVPQFLMDFLPWLGLGLGISKVVASPPRTNRFKPVVMLAAWAVMIFLFFSASSSKLPGYIVPIFPALAILAALALERMPPARWRRQLDGMLVVSALGLVAAPVLHVMWRSGDASQLQYSQFVLWIGAGCLVAVIGLGMARYLIGAVKVDVGADVGSNVGSIGGRQHMLKSIAAASLAIFAATTIAMLGHETIGRSASGVDLVPSIEKVLTPGMPIYSVRALDHTLPFYLKRTMTMVDIPDELEFGVHQEPQKWVPTIDAFISIWATGPHAIALMSHDTFTMLHERGVAMTPVAEDARRVVVSNFGGTAP